MPLTRDDVITHQLTELHVMGGGTTETVDLRRASCTRILYCCSHSLSVQLVYFCDAFVSEAGVSAAAASIARVAVFSLHISASHGSCFFSLQVDDQFTMEQRAGE